MLGREAGGRGKGVGEYGERGEGKGLCGRERERERDVKRVLGGECGGEGSGEDCERNVEHG